MSKVFKRAIILPMRYLSWLLNSMLTSILNYTFVTAVIVLIFLALFSARAYSRFLKHLRVEHPVIWTKIGGPSISMGESDESADSASARFFWSREYLKLSDSDLHRLGNRARRLSILLLMAISAVLVLGCLALVLGM